MSILLFMGDAAGAEIDPAAVPGVPTSAPWHMANPVSITGYDGTDESLHPSVVDFGPGQQWNGYRFWMAHTPHPATGGLVGSDFEDPCIAASNDCLHWVPRGPQPLDRWDKSRGGFHSDTELVYNKAADRLEVFYRAPGTEVGTSQMLKRSHSTDGVNWSPYSVAVPSHPDRSPCIAEFAPGDWRMFSQASNNVDGIVQRKASSPEGPWSQPVVCTPIDMPASMWHIGMVRRDDGVILGLSHQNADRPITTFRSDDDGASFRWLRDVITVTPNTWAHRGLYRPTLVLHENGTHARVWYSGLSGSLGYRIGYTELPLELWEP